MGDVRAAWVADQPAVACEEPDIDVELTEQVEGASRRGFGDQMLFDRIQSGIGDATAVEGAERKCEPQGLDENPHTDGRPARRDGETDAGVAKLHDRGLGCLGQSLVPGEKRAVDIGHHERNFVHARFPSPCPYPSWRTISSTIASTGASIETVIAFSSARGGSSVLNWLLSRFAGMK